MAIIKCKMCGGELALTEGSTIAQCEYCGTTQTVPAADNEKKLTLFARANRLRAACEFDKAAGIFEAIVADFPEEAEAYWGLVLCKYGVEYVDDPATGKKIPTCHRSSFDSIMRDGDYEQTLENADPASRKVYREEAKVIEEIRKGIIEVSGKEAPYDIFICYKETDVNGKRTLDSVLAQDIYDALTEKDYRVFFARITLEDKLGQEYEPYIFAALNSAKIMLCVGTDYEYFNAVWVKNEWSRFLKLMEQDKQKHLIPCYKGIDAYDMPGEFAKLQAQDLDKMGAIQDIVRGVQKLLPRQEQIIKETVVVQQTAANFAPLLKRATMSLEDGNWAKADELYEQVLNQDPENAQGYLGKLLAEQRVSTQEALKDCATPFDRSDNYQKVIRFGDDRLKAALVGYIDHINTRNENARLEGIYTRAKNTMTGAATEAAFMDASALFAQIAEYKDSSALMQDCREKAEVARKDDLLEKGRASMTGEKVAGYESAMECFAAIPGWKDADTLAACCQKKISEINAKAEAVRKEAERAAKRRMKITAIVAAAIAALAAFAVFVFTVIIPTINYNNAVALMDSGKYEEAIAAFEAMDGYKDSADLILECNYSNAVILEESGQLDKAAISYGGAGNYSDAQSRSSALWEKLAIRNTIGVGDSHIVGLKSDGTVVAVGSNDYGQRDVSEWKDIVAIAVGENHTVGLNSNGTVVATGNNEYGQCDVGNWKNVVAIAAGGNHTVGLKSDGTVVATGNVGYKVGDWTDIVAIAAGGNHTAGLKLDGTVVATSNVGHNVGNWTDIVAIASGKEHIVGLKSDGTVVADGDNSHGQCNMGNRTNIVAIAAGEYRTVGLKSDGTCVETSSIDPSHWHVSGWKDIVAIAVGENHTVGLKSDGTVIVGGSRSTQDQRKLDNWTDIKVPNE